MFLKLMLRIVEVYSNVLVLISQVAALNWSDTIYPNLGYPHEGCPKSTFLHEKWSECTLSINDVPELMLSMVEVLNNVLVLFSHVAVLNWSDIKYPHLGYPCQNAENRNFWNEKWSESTLIISDVPETYVEYSLGLWQSFGINQPSGRAQLKWNHIPELRVPSQKRRKSRFLHEEWSESNLSISDVLETYVENSKGPKQRFGINQPSGRAQPKWHHIPKLRVPPSKTPKIIIFTRRVNWKYFIH